MQTGVLGLEVADEPVPHCRGEQLGKVCFRLIRHVANLVEQAFVLAL